MQLDLEHPRVIDGFLIFIDIFGEKGRGARSAVGMSSLPFNIAVEVEITIKIRLNEVFWMLGLSIACICSAN